MAKKFKLDFSTVEERSKWNTKHIPAGVHRAKVEGVQVTEAKDGTNMLVYELVPTSSEYKTRRFPYYCKLQQNQLWKLRDLLVASGQSVPKKAVQIDPEKVVGSVVAIEVEDDTYNGVTRSTVTGVFSTDVLDDEEEEASEELDEMDELDELNEEEETLPEEDDFDDFDEDDLDDLDDLDEEEATKKKATKKKATKKKATKK